MRIVFATNNAHKLAEIKDILSNDFEIISLAELGCYDDIPETAETLEGNASIKARYVYERYGVNCFADDTGLEVDALGGEPGVKSARYAEGTDHNSEANMEKLLGKLNGVVNRKARFRTVISLILNGTEHRFEGKVEGTIAQEKSGEKGFGYDPIFIPKGFDKSFAELGEAVKNKISHRANAVAALANFLTQFGH
ncbi:MAG: non-canonical purine NTP diphosphatase [Prevotella sp.]|nr:non-canonical purine NTP diphosphatase [Prevotellaceae bacterium]MDY3935190.1 non-canonical purine NTP diphosphatase [Prevotella sp.]